MKILHVLDHSLPLHSGYTFRTAAIIREQRKLGWGTCHVTSSKQGTEHADSVVEELEFYRSRPCDGPLSTAPLFDQLCVVRNLQRRVAEIVTAEQPDLLHAHSPCLTALAALPVARRSGRPLVYEMRASWEDAAVSHGTTREGSLRYRLSRQLETYVLKRADALTTICQGLHRDMTGRGIDPQKVTVIPNAVEANQFRYQAPRDAELAKALGLDACVVLGFIGSFYRYEGLDLAIEALPQLVSNSPEIRLLLVGGGEHEAALRSRVTELGLEQQVIFTGRVPHAEVSRYYSIIDLLVYPRVSIRLTEITTPLKPLEAMAMGKVVVASDIGGHRELIDANRTGYLFQAGSPDSLAATIGKALSQRSSWPDLTTTARAYVEQERTWAKSVARYERVYSQALASAGAAR